MKNRQFIVLCILIIVGFSITWLLLYKQHTRIEYVNDRVSLRADKLIDLEEEYNFTTEIVWEHSKAIRWKKAR